MCRFMPLPSPRKTARMDASWRHKRPNERRIRHHKGMTSVWRRINKAMKRFSCRKTVLFVMYDEGMTKTLCNFIKKYNGIATRVVGWVASCVRRTDWHICARVVGVVAFPWKVKSVFVERSLSHTWPGQKYLCAYSCCVFTNWSFDTMFLTL